MSPTLFFKKKRKKFKIYFTFSFLLLWGMLRWEAPVSAGRQCCHTLTAEACWGLSGLTIQTCDRVRATTTCHLIPALAARHRSHVVKKKDMFHNWRKHRLCSLLPYCCTLWCLLYILYPTDEARDACPLNVVVFSNCHKRAVLYLERRR